MLLLSVLLRWWWPQAPLCCSIAAGQEAVPEDAEETGDIVHERDPELQTLRQQSTQAGTEACKAEGGDVYG